MTIDWGLVANVVGPIVAVGFGAWLTHTLEGRPSLLSYVLHTNAITTYGNSGSTSPLTVHTHSIVVRNTSKLAANNVRIGHQTLPDFTIYPPVNYTVNVLPDGSSEILIPKLVRSEQITISYLYFPPLTWDKINSYTKSDEGFAKVIPVLLIAPPSAFVKRLIWFLIAIGFSTVIYLSVLLFRYCFL